MASTEQAVLGTPNQRFAEKQLLSARRGVPAVVARAEQRETAARASGTFRVRY